MNCTGCSPTTRLECSLKKRHNERTMPGKLTITERGTLVRSGDGPDGNSCAFPSVTVLPGGRWLVGYRASSRKWNEGDQHIRLTWSDDQGRSWHRPIRPFEAPLVAGRPGRFRM